MIYFISKESLTQREEGFLRQIMTNFQVEFKCIDLLEFTNNDITKYQWLHYEKEDFIITLGTEVSHKVLDTKTALTKLRVGAPKEYNGCKIIPTWDIQTVISGTDKFEYFYADLNKVNWVPKKRPKVDVQILDEFFINQANLLELFKDSPVVIDIETGISCGIERATIDDNDLLCVGISNLEYTVVITGAAFEFYEDQVKTLSKYNSVIFHDCGFDFPILEKQNGIDFTSIRDTMLAHYILDERPGTHSLNYLIEEYLEMPTHKDITKGVTNFADIDPEILYQYCGKDCYTTFLLYEELKKELTQSQVELHQFLVDATKVTAKIKEERFNFDMEYSKELYEKLTKESAILLQTLTNLAADETFNPNSPAQVKKILQKLGCPVESTGVEILANQVFIANPEAQKFIESLLRYRKSTKLSSTFVKSLQGMVHKGRLGTQLSLTNTTSGRLASSNVNLQNLDRSAQIRRQLIVDNPENIFIQADYKQAEGRVIAWLAEDDYLLNIYNDPTRDIFAEMCNDIFGEGKWDKEDRVLMKSFFYGIAYGRGPVAIAKAFRIEVKKAKRIHKEFCGVVHKTISWQKTIRKHIKCGNVLTTPFGRERRFRLVTPENEFKVMNEALSFLPQSIASDICLSALIELDKQIGDMGKIKMTIHDAIITECHEKYENEMKELMQNVMVNAGKKLTQVVEFSVDHKVGRSLGDLSD